MPYSFLLFDSIAESHVCLSLQQALQSRGHTVHATGPVWQGHKFPSRSDDYRRIHDALENALALRPDVLFNFRASSLPPELVDKVRKQGVISIVWLPDDPVLYDLCYKVIIDAYDIVLHCGSASMLGFYETKGHRPGINFPFWTSQDFFPYCYAPDEAEWDLVFLGNCRGRVRGSRYDLIASLPFNLRIFGRVDDDPHGLLGGFINDINNSSREITRAFGNAKMGLSIPQVFADYAGSSYDFPELKGLGFFPLPSRIIQYAASGLPVFSLQPDTIKTLFPDAESAPTIREAIALLRELLHDNACLVEVSKGINTHFQKYYSAMARGIVLEKLLESPEEWERLSTEDRAHYFLDHPAEISAPPWEQSPSISIFAPRHPNSLDRLRLELREKIFRAPNPRRVLSIGTSLTPLGGTNACIVRAMENLGHEVLHLDPTQLPLSNGITGFLDPYCIETHIRRYCPDVLLLLEGGIGFVPEDARALKNSGVKLAALVMSPQDIPGLSDAFFCGAATESIRERCCQEKVSGSVLFPHAVDQACACAVVPLSEEYTADVLAIQGRDDTFDSRAAMNRLAARIKGLRLRKEGRGPDTRQDAECFRTMRQTRIHVDFSPLQTAAPLADVFASIASGGVVCVPRGSEVEKLFSCDTEVVCYEDLDDLTRHIAGLLQDPALMEAVRCASFSRLAREHLYEHRLLSFFKLLDTEFVKSDTDPKPFLPSRRVTILGYYGAGNIGDELILRSIAQSIASPGMGVTLAVAAENPAAVISEHSLQAFPRKDIVQAESQIAKATALILGGGGLWHDHSFDQAGGLTGLFSENNSSVTGYSKLPLLAKVHGKAFHVHGMGVGPLKRQKARQHVRFLAELADSIVVRDKASSELLRTAGLDKPVEIAPDVVYALDIQHLAPPPELREFCSRGKVLGVNLRPWKEHDEKAFTLRMVETLTKVHETTGACLLGIPFQTPHDNTALRRVFNGLPASVPHLLYEPKGPDRIDLSLGALRCCNLLLAMRLHALLLTLRMGIPAVGLSYAPKISALFEEVGCPELCLPLNSRPAIVLDALSLALSASTSIKDMLARSIPSLEKNAREGLARLHRRIREAAAPEKPYVLDLEPTPPARKEERHVVPVLCFPLENKDLSLSSPVWNMPRDIPGITWEQRDDTLRVTYRAEEPFYLKQDSKSFKSLPGARKSARLEPDCDYILVAESIISDDDVDARLHVIEYSSTRRVQTTLQSMSGTRTVLSFHTTPDTVSFRVAIRFSGAGVVELRDIRLFSAEGARPARVPQSGVSPHRPYFPDNSNEIRILGCDSL